MVFQPGMRVLEVGCQEANWLALASEAWPDCMFTGIDTREDHRPGGTRLRLNAIDPNIFPPESFDAVVSLSAIEHVGLGHYGDPVDPDGDSKAVANIWRWLKPGGWFYFDVPYDPTKYYLLGKHQTEARVYDDLAILDRLRWSSVLVPDGSRTLSVWLPDPYYRFSDSVTPGMLIEKPTEPAKRYYYVAMVWRKA